MVKVRIESPDGPLEAVVLSRPPKDLPAQLPSTWSEMPDLDSLHREWGMLESFLRSRFETYVVDIASADLYDAMFIRDIACVIGDYLLLTKSGVEHRSGEHDAACRAFVEAGIGRWPWAEWSGFCEGADVLPVSEREWLIGVGARTDEAGARYVMQWASSQDVQISTVGKEGPSVPQHLLGGNRVVGGVLYTRRDVERIPWDGPVCVLDHEEEVVQRYSMNWLTISKTEVLMADDCPDTKSLLEANGVNVNTLPMGEIRKLEGGFACATLPIRRGSA